MKFKPYQQTRVCGHVYCDYNVKIRGIIYEISFDIDTKDLFIVKDQNQGK